MFYSQLLIAAVLAAAHIRLVTSFQLGSDYDKYKTTNLYNCTGHVPVSNVTVVNAFDTLPQVEGFHGWEQWSLFLHGTFPILLRWSQGDPSCSMDSPAKFDVLIVDVNGTNIQGTVTGNLSYTNGEHFKRIAIRDNSLTWDSHALWYNVSVNIHGYELRLDSFAATHDAFHPNVAFHNGLLDQSGGWFGSVPLLRGHASGSLHTPMKQNITLNGLAVMRHIFSENPQHSSVTKYSGGTVWGYSTDFYDSHVFYKTETANGTVHEAAFLGRALPGQRDTFSSAWATYAITDDPNAYHLSIDSETRKINASFPGCSNTSNTPYLFNFSVSTLVGEFTENGGGKTSYYSIVNGTTTASFDAMVKNGALAGIFEEYQAPERNISMNNAL
ncbi:hypothetical protein L210DRAFT_3647169 [Boletus edulis BED1]|uniref:Uncharacterized protein n=1 Tax=Boletus edulis BED1 TaxID=1328754 RepID=A0AAD4BRQ2_BOLED|nr:hypothetical protein L210DRAFT_3647169 [Boletus edulis BED1]